MYTLFHPMKPDISVVFIRQTHVLLMESQCFPDRPDETWYARFNQQFFETLGISATDTLHKQFASLCRSFPWKPFADTTIFERMTLPCGILSNWDMTLPMTLARHFSYPFAPVIVSSLVGMRKPDAKYFQYALAQARIDNPNEAIMIGDSLRFDIEPAQKIGMRTILLDRYAIHPSYTGEKIATLEEMDLMD